MQLVIKDIVLVDKSDTVMGFVQIRVEETKTIIKIGHNYQEKNIMLSLSTHCGTNAFSLSGNQDEFILSEQIDASREIFAVLIKRDGHDILSLASGIVNMEGTAKPVYTLSDSNNYSPPPSSAIEIDDLLRSVCADNVHNIHNCKDCPYRKDFFEITG